MTVEDGILSAEGSGTTHLTCNCSNFDEITATVQVTDEGTKTLQLPADLKELADDAFADTFADYLIAGNLPTIIGNQVTGPNTDIICPSGSHMAGYAEENGYHNIAF